MIVTLAFHDAQGRIACVVSCDETQAHLQQWQGLPSVAVGEGAVRDDTHRILDGAAAPRPALPALPTVAGVEWTASGLPAGALEVRFDGAHAAQVPIVDGAATLTLGAPGRWEVIPPFPFMPAAVVAS